MCFHYIVQVVHAENFAICDSVNVKVLKIRCVHFKVSPNFIINGEFQPFQRRWDANFVQALDAKRSFRVSMFGQPHRRILTEGTSIWLIWISSIFNDGKVTGVELSKCTWIVLLRLRNKQVINVILYHNTYSIKIKYTHACMDKVRFASLTVFHTILNLEYTFVRYYKLWKKWIWENHRQLNLEP